MHACAMQMELLEGTYLQIHNKAAYHTKRPKIYPFLNTCKYAWLLQAWSHVTLLLYLYKPQK